MAQGSNAPWPLRYVAVSNRPGSLARLLTRRIWLPRWLYAAVPWLYLLLGSTALASAVLLPEPDWILPFVYNIGFPGFQASVLVWLFLGGLVALDNMNPQAAEGESQA